jgi:predicted metal-dependent phosphoesterase TrpH
MAPEHPEAVRWSRREQYQAVQEAGGCVVQAHPFRQHFYIHQITLSPTLVDGIEAANAGNHDQSYDALALRYAKKLGLPVTAGSDIHETGQLEARGVFGVYLDKKMETIADYTAAIKGNAITGLKISPRRCDSRGDETVSLPVEILNADERDTGQDLWDFLKN